MKHILSWRNEKNIYLFLLKIKKNKTKKQQKSLSRALVKHLYGQVVSASDWTMKS